MERELISVIVPIYNAAEYLEKCIRSICQQTYDKLEIILVNDGSTDESGLICEKLRGGRKGLFILSKRIKGKELPETRHCLLQKERMWPLSMQTTG